MSTCRRCGAPTPAGARFCPACGAAVADGPATSQALKTVTVVFIDLVESTALGERLDPESLSSVMHEYFETIRGVVARYGGSVEKFIGDAVVAVFGVPVLHEDDALRAVSAAAAIHRAIDDLGARLRDDAGFVLRIRTGVNTGEVLSQSETGSTGRLVGDAVNLAARLQQAAAPGDILLGPSTHALVGDRVRVETLDPFVAKGRSTPVEAYRLLEVIPAQRTPARPRSPIVGRDRDVRLARETLQRVVEERTPHLFTVLGAPGIGKSRLVAELEDTDDAVVLHGRCLPYGEGITYWPLAEMVQRAADIESDDAPRAARSKLLASAGDDEDAAAIADRIAQVVGLSESPVTADDLSWATRKYLERLASSRPLVAVFEDVHWAEPAMLDLIEGLLDGIADVPLLVVCVARPELLELRPTWGGGKPNASSLVLGALNEADCRALVGSLLGESPSLEQVTEAVFRVADGNPLFVEEMVSMLVDEGLLDNAGGQWRAARDLASLNVPPTIQALVSARLDRLNLEEREVVGVAAVMGKVFAPRAVRDLATAGASVDEALERLTRKQLVAPEGGDFAGDRTYTFRHLLIRDTAYEHLPRLTRATIHERYAGWLVKVLGERSAEYDEIVGYHLEQAHRYLTQMGVVTGGRGDLASRAAERLAEGGRRALARQDAAAAVKLLTRAADLVTSDRATRLTVLPDLGRALFESGIYGPAVEAFEEAVRLGEALGDERAATVARVFSERVKIHRDPQVNAEAVLPVAEEAVVVLERLGDHYGLSYAWDLTAFVHDCAGRSAEALTAFREASRHADESGITSLIGYQKRALVRFLAWGPGHVQETIGLADELLGWARTVGDRYSETRALLSLAQAYAMSGDLDAASECVRSQEEICSDVSFAFIHASGAFERAQVAMLSGNRAVAEAEARAGCEFLERIGEKGILPTLQTQLADLVYASGDLAEARKLAESARDLSAPDDSLTEMKWRSVLSKIAAREGDVDEAIRLARDAAAVGAETGYLDWYAGVLVDTAEAMTVAGCRADAIASLEEAEAIFLRKGNAVSAGAVKEKLREVSGA